MGILSRGRAALPPTRYGYVPPPDAVGKQWICVADRCGRGGPDYPGERWPSRCPGCGGTIATHQLAEPWDHAARRVEIDKRLTSMPGYGDPLLATGDDMMWHLTQELHEGSVVRAEEFRRRLGEFVTAQEAADGHFHGGTYRFRICWTALEHGALDLVVRELTDWNASAVLVGLEDDNTRRTNCRQLASSMIRFLEDPRSERSPDRVQVWNALAQLMRKIRNVATADHNTAFSRLSRVMSGGNRNEEAMTAFLVSCQGEDRRTPAGGTLPSTTAQRMVVFAHHSLAGPDSGIDTSLIWSVCLQPYMQLGMASSEQLARQLAAITLAESGPAVVGAARCLQELGYDGSETAEYFAVLDAALDHLHITGQSADVLTWREQTRWAQTHGPDTW